MVLLGLFLWSKVSDKGYAFPSGFYDHDSLCLFLAEKEAGVPLSHATASPNIS